MALNTRNVDIVLTEGINQKLDNKSTSLSTLLTLENRVFIKQGAVSKRFGNKVISERDVANNNPITGMRTLAKYKEDELLLFTDTKLYSFVDSLDRWAEKATVSNASVELSSIVADDTTDKADIDSATANGLTIHAWSETGSGAVKFTVTDNITKTYVINPTSAGNTGDHIRCVALAGTLIVLYGSGSHIRFISVKSTSPGEAPVEGTITTGGGDLAASHFYDAIVEDSRLFITYTTTTVGTAKLVDAIYDSGNLVLKNTKVMATVDIGDAVAIGSYLSAGLRKLNIGFEDRTTGNLEAIVIDASTFVTEVAAVIIDSGPSAITKISMVSSTTDTMIFVYQQAGSTPQFDFLKSNTLTLAGAVGTASVFKRGAGLVTRGFIQNGQAHIGVLQETDLQSTVFILNEAGEVVTKYAEGQSGSHSKIWAPVNILSTEEGIFSFDMQVKGRIRSENATLFSNLNISEAEIDFTSSIIYNSVNINNNLLAVGGILNSYDGALINENGFHLFPENITVGAGSGSGSVASGTYLYSVIYSYTDNQGNKHRSAPSIAVSHTVSGPDDVDIVIPTLKLTNKTGIIIEVFRTEASGSIPHKVTSVSSPTLNDPTTDTVTVTDTLVDSAIISNEILYTTGGILDNIAAPSCDLIASHDNRIFIAGLADKNEIRFSKIIRVGEGTAFNEGLSIKLDPKGGDITQLASMDANLIVFKRDNLYVIAGDGGVDTGTGVTFNPQLISTDVGCVDTNSVILGPDGLYFKSAKGIYLLTRGLETIYIGANVEDFNNSIVSSSQLLDDVNEVRFTSLDGTTLVYNYYFKRWSTFIVQKIKDSVIWQNNMVFIDFEDLISQEDNTTFRDRGAYVNSKISTGWIRTGGIQGFQRCKRVSILGTFKSKHTVKITIFSNDSNVVNTQKLFTPNTILSVDGDFYGDEIYGVISPYGGADNGLYQLQLTPKIQKAQSFRVVIEDDFDNGLNTTGEGMVLNAVTLAVGVKRGLNRVAASRKG